jgi:hypothetical protein
MRLIHRAYDSIASRGCAGSLPKLDLVIRYVDHGNIGERKTLHVFFPEADLNDEQVRTKSVRLIGTRRDADYLVAASMKAIRQIRSAESFFGKDQDTNIFSVPSASDRLTLVYIT